MYNNLKSGFLTVYGQQDTSIFSVFQRVSGIINVIVLIGFIMCNFTCFSFMYISNGLIYIVKELPLCMFVIIFVAGFYLLYHVVNGLIRFVIGMNIITLSSSIIFLNVNQDFNILHKNI